MSQSEINPSLVRLACFFSVLIVLFLFEILRPYREPYLPRAGRWLDNLGITLLNNILLTFSLAPLVSASLAYSGRVKTGLFYIFEFHFLLKLFLTVIIMDFLLYIWHLLNHVVPFFWRFHRVHHSDLNMDVSTATRFHFGELAISALIKASVILFLGIDIVGLLVFDMLVLATAQFQHSSLRVPERFERWYWLLFVPPSMHRIHHSVVIRERDSNYGTIFSIWDRILGTMKKNVDQDKIRIGVGAYSDFNKTRFLSLLLMPVTRKVK
ncbi:MAG: sterol desaturase family protein [Desulfobacteraceae bacterium]|nr:MAG: sterol desaturase family protein [Desulfobacteraceae bacterium]